MPVVWADQVRDWSAVRFAVGWNFTPELLAKVIHTARRSVAPVLHALTCIIARQHSACRVGLPLFAARNPEAGAHRHVSILWQLGDPD